MVASNDHMSATNIKSSFMQRTLSKEDAIIQFLRPQLSNKVGQTLHILETMVNEAETLTKLGTMLQPGGERYHVTAEELEKTLDEFPELQKLATKGRELLNELGYKSLRQHTPLPGSAPVGETIEIQPITTQLPGEEALTGALVKPK